MSGLSTINLAVLISGSGTTLQNLIDQIAAGKLDAKIKIVIASRDGIKGIERARGAGLPVEIIERKKFASIDDFSNAMFSRCTGVDLVCLAGWLSLLKIPQAFAGKVMNIHPALLPDFGGPGMFGKHVHEAVLKSGMKISGCTVHFVDDHYDAGPIILQRVCPVLENDTPETLAARVFEEEKIAYPSAIKLFQSGSIQLRDGRVSILKQT